MRKSKGLIISAVLVLTGLGAVLIKSKIWQKSVSVAEFFDQKTNEVCFNDLCLQKKNENWFLNYEGKTMPANNEVAEVYLKKIKEIKLEEIVSENSNRLAEYGLDKNGVAVKIEDKKLGIGNINSFYDGTYVLDNSKGIVYLVPIIFDRNNLISPDYWRKKEITNLSIDQIKKITINLAGKTKITEPKNGKWPNQKWIEKIGYLKAGQFLPDFRPEGEKYVLEIETEKEKINLTIGKKIVDKKKSIYWATAGNGWYFEIEESDYRLLTDQFGLLRLN